MLESWGRAVLPTTIGDVKSDDSKIALSYPAAVCLHMIAKLRQIDHPFAEDIHTTSTGEAHRTHDV